MLLNLMLTLKFSTIFTFAS